MSGDEQGKAVRGLSRSTVCPIADVLAFALTAAAICWASQVPRYLGFGFYPQQFFALILACALPIASARLPVAGSIESSRIV